jgi:hypothetical protein
MVHVTFDFRDFCCSPLLSFAVYDFAVFDFAVFVVRGFRRSRFLLFAVIVVRGF